MSFGFVVNAIDDPVASQTTVMLMAAALRRGRDVAVWGVEDFELDRSGDILARCVWLEAASDVSPDRVVAMLTHRRRRERSIYELDAVLLRTNPARDTERAALHQAALAFCALARDRGTPIYNDPDALRRSGGKLDIARLDPADAPETHVSADPQRLIDWVRDLGGADAVLKPIDGTRGNDVFRVNAGDGEHMRRSADRVCANGYGMAQAFADGAERGDVRVIVLAGAPLVVDGALAAIHRVPSDGDFRSNVHQGGQAVPAELSRSQHLVIDRLARRIFDQGFFLAGLDLIGTKVVEVNVFATGGLRDAEAFYGADFSSAIIEAMARDARAHGV